MNLFKSLEIGDLALTLESVLVDSPAQETVLTEWTPEEVNFVTHGYLAQSKEFSMVTQIDLESHALLFIVHDLLPL